MGNEVSVRFIDPPKQYMRRKDNKLYALVAIYIDYKDSYHLLVPWENRFNHEAKHIKPEKITNGELNKEYELKE